MAIVHTLDSSVRAIADTTSPYWYYTYQFTPTNNQLVVGLTGSGGTRRGYLDRRWGSSIGSGDVMSNVVNADRGAGYLAFCSISQITSPVIASRYVQWRLDGALTMLSAALSLSGVNLADPIGGIATTSGGGSSWSFPVVCQQAGSLVIALYVCDRTEAVTWTNGFTPYFMVNSSTFTLAAAYKENQSGTVTVSGSTPTVAYHAIAVCTINPAIIGDQIIMIG